MQNEEADALTDGEYHHFDSKLRIGVGLDKFGFIVMNDLFAEGKSYVKELAELKNAEASKKQTSTGATAAGESKKGPSLREREPWG